MRGRLGKTWELLKERLKRDLAPHGAVSEFARRANVNRSTVDKWLEKDGNVPSLDSLDAIAKGLGKPPWELIKPEGAEPAKSVREDLLAVLTAFDESQMEALADAISAIRDAREGTSGASGAIREK